jgi:hypothetical protein
MVYIVMPAINKAIISAKSLLLRGVSLIASSSAHAAMQNYEATYEGSR